jgi:cell wall-associated NlpC family hydrolase
LRPCGQHFGQDLLDSDLVGDPRGSCLVVAGEHDRTDAELLQRSQPGDLVFFRGLGRMGMYTGGGNFIDAPHTGDVVKISCLSDSYYTANWVGARRVV